jgi:hypothetical protein
MQIHGVPVASGFVAVGLYIWNTTRNDQTKNYNKLSDCWFSLIPCPQVTPRSGSPWTTDWPQAMDRGSSHSMFCISYWTKSAVHVSAYRTHCMQALSTPLSIVHTLTSFIHNPDLATSSQRHSFVAQSTLPLVIMRPKLIYTTAILTLQRTPSPIEHYKTVVRCSYSCANITNTPILEHVEHLSLSP